ncbi:MAG: hypothetical protein Q8P35_02235 [Candidatus Yanofskybacteria bacterium]|nr:hypothetical protein [Candidatus Yanofskybacteria bacterium]
MNQQIQKSNFNSKSIGKMQRFLLFIGVFSSIAFIFYIAPAVFQNSDGEQLAFLPEIQSAEATASKCSTGTNTWTSGGTIDTAEDAPSSEFFSGAWFRSTCTPVNGGADDSVVSSITVTVNDATGLSNMIVYTDTVTDCTTLSGWADTFGTSTTVDADTVITGTAAVSVATGPRCFYVVLDIGTGAADQQVLDISVTAVSVTATTVSGIPQNPTGSTTISNAGGATIDVSGTCKQNDGTTNCTDTGTIRIAINGSLDGATQTTVAGSWTITGVTEPSSAGDVITVFIDGVVSSEDRAVSVTTWTSGNITGLELIEGRLSIGSDTNGTVTNANLSQYDNSVAGDADVIHEVDANNDLAVDTNNAVTGDELYIKSGNTYRPDSASSGNVTTSRLNNRGTLTADGNTLTASGSWDNNGTFTANTSTVVMTGISATLDGHGGDTFNNLTINPSSAGTITASGSFTVSGGLEVAAGDTLSIPSGATLTFSGATGTFNGTISGAGRLTYLSSNAFPTTGIISCILRFDATNNAQTMSNRTYGGSVEIFKTGSTARTVTMSAGTHTISGHLHIIEDGTNNLTLNGATNDPTINITGDLDFTGTGGGNEVFSVGGGTMTVSGNVDLTGGTTSGETGTTLVLDGTSKTLTTGGNTLLHLTLSGTITLANETHTIQGDLDMTGGTITAGSSTIKMVTGVTPRTITGGGNTLNNLTIDPTSAVTVTLQTSNLTVSGQLIVAPGDTFVINSGITLTLSGSGTPLLLYATSIFSPNSASTVVYSGTSATTIAPTRAGDAYGNLSLIPAGTVTYTLASASSQTIAINGIFSMGNGTNAVTVTAATHNPILNLSNNLTIAAGAAYASGSSTTTFKNGASQTVTDNTASKQNLGEVRVSVNGGNTTLNLGSSVKIASLSIDASQTLNVNGSNTLTLSGTSTAFTNNGTFQPSTGTVQYTGSTVNILATVYNNLTLGGVGTYTLPNTTITINGNLVITSGATVTKGTGTLLFSKEGTQSITDNTASKQDLGEIRISGGEGITFIDKTTADMAAEQQSSISIDVPAGVQENDLLLAILVLTDGIQGTPDLGQTAPAGWTAIHSAGGVPNVAVLVYRKIAGASEPSSYTFEFRDDTPQSIDVGGVGMMLAYRGVDTTTPIDAFEGLHQVNIGTTLTAPSVTSTVNNTRNIVIYGWDVGNGVGTVTLPSGYAERAAIQSIIVLGTSRGLVADKNQEAAGASGAQDATHNNVSTDGVGFQVALTPAGGASSTTLTLGSSVQVSSISIDASQTLDLNGSNTLTITGTGTPFTSAGTFTRSTGIVTFIGPGATNIPALNYYDLKIQPSADSATHTFLAGTASVSKTFTVGNGINIGITVDANTIGAGLDVASVSISENTTLVGDDSLEFTIMGNFINNGSFTHSSGTVTFAGANTSSVTGTTTFNDFVSTAAGKKIKFGAKNIFTVAGTFTVTGAESNTIKLESTASASQWAINFNSPQSAVTYATVTDAGCQPGSLNLTLDATSFNGGNNGNCWAFPGGGVPPPHAGGGGAAGGGGGGSPTGGGDSGGGNGGSGNGGSGGGEEEGGGDPGGGGGGSPVLYSLYSEASLIIMKLTDF